MNVSSMTDELPMRWLAGWAAECARFSDFAPQTAGPSLNCLIAGRVHAPKLRQSEKLGELS